MAKYDPLRDRLVSERRAVVVLYLWEIDELLPRGLPASARSHRAWWGNEADVSHVQARAWLDAGYRVKEVIRPDGPVTFRQHVEPAAVPPLVAAGLASSRGRLAASSDGTYPRLLRSCRRRRQPLRDGAKITTKVVIQAAVNAAPAHQPL